MSRKFLRLSQIFSALFLFAPTLDSHAVCKTCDVRSTREDSPTFCDDIYENVCRKNETRPTVSSPVLGNVSSQSIDVALESFNKNKPIMKGMFAADPNQSDYVTDILEPGYRKFMAAQGEKTYRGFAKKIFGADYKINLSEDLEKEWEFFFTRDANEQAHRKLFPDYDACEKQRKVFDKTLADRDHDQNGNGFKDLWSQMLNFRSNLIEQLKAYYSKDIKAFAQSYFAEMCKQRSQDLSADDKKRCSNFSLLRKEVIELTAEEPTQDREKREKELVKKWFVLPQEWIGSTASEAAKDGSNVRNLVSQVFYSLADLCSNRDSAFKFALIKTENELFYERFLQSKTFIEYSLDTFATKERQEKVQALGTQVKSTIRERLSALPCASKEDLARVREDFDRIQISPLEKPNETAYRTNQNGEKVLKTPEWGDPGTPLHALFSMGSARLFTSTNAEYFGKNSKQPPRIMLYGDLYKNAAKSPEDARFWIAHEIGHHFASHASEMYYPSLIGCFKALRSCLEPKTKDNVRPYQMNESIADVVAAEYTASELEKLPAQSRREEFRKYMPTLCRWEKEASDRFADFSFDTHADQIIRLNYLVGGNKKLRKALGCSLESKKVPVCELNLEGVSP